MLSDYLFTSASESELNDLIAGSEAGFPLPWAGSDSVLRLPAGSVGVVWRRPRQSDDPVHPLMLVVRKEDHKRLFGRYAQLRGDLSPLSAWCHVIESRRFQTLDSLARDTDLGGLEAAWTGLIVAESLLLAERSISSLRIAACLATQSFAIARAKALWPTISTNEVVDRYDAAQQLFRSGESRVTRLRSCLEPIWACLAEASGAPALPTNSELHPIIASLRALYEVRTGQKSEETYSFAEPLREVVPEADLLEALPDLTPEQRVQAFDKIVTRIDEAGSNGITIQRHTLALLAGYLATVAAGGAPSMSLVEASSHRLPEITAWAYVVGGIGERIVWTSSFDGLGRLVARELMRPLRLDEPPTCDFALDEATVLSDRQLTNPLVHLRIKQSRIVTVSLLPGVNIQIPLGDQPIQESRKLDAGRERRKSIASTGLPSNEELFSAIADAVWPYLRARLDNHIDTAKTADGAPKPRKSQKGRTRKRTSPQAKLPLKEPGDK